MYPQKAKCQLKVMCQCKITMTGITRKRIIVIIITIVTNFYRELAMRFISLTHFIFTASF